MRMCSRRSYSWLTISVIVIVVLHNNTIVNSLHLHQHAVQQKTLSRPKRRSQQPQQQQKTVTKYYYPALYAKQQQQQQQQQSKDERIKRRSIPSRIVHIYTDYASRLWKETNTESRRRNANDRIAATIRQVQKILKATDNNNSYVMEYADVPEKARKELYDACEAVLKAIQLHQDKRTQQQKLSIDDHNNNIHEDGSENGFNSATEILNGSYPNGSSSSRAEKTTVSSSTSSMLSTSSSSPEIKPASSMSNIIEKPTKKRNRRSIAFGALMGTVVAGWVFSGNYIFTGLFTLMTILGQLEYYRMIMNTGVYPARRISICGACSMFLTALLCPDLHQICLPIFGLWAMIWFLTFKRTVTTIPEIATTFTGMFYLGYVPSFWVRIRLIGMDREPTRLAPLVAPILNFIGNRAGSSPIIPSWVPQAVHLPITTGAIFIFWTWLCLAFSDVGAYFVGKFHGKTKLGTISPAAGATSPNKTVEGVLGGCTTSAILAILGAWVQRWPYPIITGTIHGVMLGLLGLIGDLTASMLKRDAGLKDFGDLLPEHGGIMDRVDSFIWSAPYSWLVCAYIIPALKQMTSAVAP